MYMARTPQITQKRGVFQTFIRSGTLINSYRNRRQEIVRKKAPII
jgi:hypothetical protein